MSKELQIRESGRSSEVGFMLASAAVPRSFQKSLLPRETTDQGIVTGLNMITAFAIGAALQTVVDKASNTTSKVAKTYGMDIKQDDVSILASAAAVGVGVGAQKLLKQKDNEKLTIAAARTMGYWLTLVGAAGIIAGGLEKVVMTASDTDDAKKTAKRRRILFPLIVPVGALVSIARDHIMYRNEVVDAEPKDNINELKSVGIGVVVAGILGLISYAERKSAKAIDNLIDEKAPYLKNSWLPVGRVVSLGVIGAGVYAAMHQLYKKIENGADKMEEYYTAVPTNPYVSGSAASAVDWNTLTLQGRRHIDGRLSKKQISEVMQTTAAKTYEPIRIFIGLESGKNEVERVTLALNELKRTGAFDRETIVILSPTGTGYVNYVFSESVEYMSKGNCASVTIQYSKRPSPMSLDRVPEGRMQLSMLVMGINREIKKRSADKRPRLVLFGESLGAWTSQDAFAGGGTDLLDAYNIERAFWIGTPAGSKWAKQVLHEERYDTIKGQVAAFNDFGQYKKLSPSAKKNLRFIMCTHDDDPIPKFGVSLLVQSPPWLKRGAERAPTIPKSNHYRTPLTFIQTMVDMKNALKPIPGQFVAVGHDYRADIADFVRVAYDFDVTEKQMAAINVALRQSDIERGKTQA